MATTRIYANRMKSTGEVVLVEAATEAQSRSHVARSEIKTWIPTVAEAIDLRDKGAKVQRAGEAAPAEDAAK